LGRETGVFGSRSTRAGSGKSDRRIYRKGGDGMIDFSNWTDEQVNEASNELNIWRLKNEQISNNLC